MKQKKYRNFMPLEQARQIWLNKLTLDGQTPLASELVPLTQARGRVLAESAAARLSSPAFHGAAMDGIAVRAQDTYGATSQRPLTLTVGVNAFWINTGRPLPPDCDAVIMSEQVFPESETQVSIEQAAYPWQHVRKMGEDLVATEIILPPGKLLGAYELGALAAGGVDQVKVFAKPRVALIPSGSEISALDQISPQELASGQKLPEFNSLMISALVEDVGGQPLVLPIVPDDPEQIATALRQAAQQADLVVIIAGSSAGTHDFTAELIEQEGELWVHGVSIMPGKPTSLGRIHHKPVIGLPGYPVSATIAFEEFGQTLLARWQKRGLPERPLALACPYQALPSKPGLEERIRVSLGNVDGTLYAVPLPRGAGTVTSLSRADGIIAVPAASEGLPANQPCPVILLRQRSEIDQALLCIGSHDNTLQLLDGFLRKQHPPFSLTSAHVGSLGGLTALRNHQCHLAGTHLLDPDSGLYNQRAISEMLPDEQIILVRLVNRQQGLLLPRGNPQQISGIMDLARSDVSMINRQRGSGTRVLLDWELARNGLNPKQINGYSQEEYTHMNVAVAVLAGRASTGLGVKAAADALGLDFLPIGEEEYDLAIPRKYWDDPRIQAVLEIVRSADFQSAACALGGYDTRHSGEIVWEA